MQRRLVILVGCSAPFVRAVEPTTITAGTIAIWLAQGAVNYVGGKLISGILGEPSIRDVKKWIRAAVEEVKVFISAELQSQITQQYINETIDRVEGMRIDLLDYGASKDQRILLQQFGSNMNTWIAVGKRLGLPAVFIYANAISLKMLTLSALVRDHRQTSYIERMQATADEGREHVEAMMADHLKWLDEGITSVSDLTFVHQPRFLPNWDCGFTFRGGRDGGGGSSKAEAEQKCNSRREERVAAFQREKEYAQTTIHKPLKQVIEGWNAAVRTIR